MAGAKETPRQKMIGMMYLVLTALLALNVSKQIISAFITLNDKLEMSADHINDGTLELYGKFDEKETVLKAQKSDMTEFNLWKSKAEYVRGRTAALVGFILSECNEMIKTSEGEDWVAARDADGNIIELKSLDDITSMDNYDVPTNLFVGGNPSNPNERGMALRDSIHAFRDMLCETIGNYDRAKKKYEFKSPAAKSDLGAALASANPEDSSAIRKIYDFLSIPEKIHSRDHGADEQPWASVTFDHAPIVAAAAMFTSMKLDIKNAESKTIEYLLSKVSAPIFTINKIEPMTYAQANYINQGDSMNLNVMIAAYDSTDRPKIRYGIDADTLPENWREVTGPISLYSQTPGQHKVKGAISVKRRGVVEWEPFEYNYTVGQPTGVVALPQMRVLYWGYDNVVEGTASGFPAERVSLKGDGVTLRPQGNGKFIAKVNRGTRNASVSVIGTNEDGSTVNLGKYDFVCKQLPAAQIYLGRATSGESISRVAAKNAKVRVALDPSVPLTNVRYTIYGGDLRVGDVPGVGKVNRGGSLDSQSKRMLNQAKGKTVNITVDYSGPDQIRRKGSLTVKVN